MRVSPSAPRSIVELAPISTSSSITSVPCCGNCVYAPVFAIAHVAKSVRTQHRAGMNHDAIAMVVPG